MPDQVIEVGKQCWIKFCFPSTNIKDFQDSLEVLESLVGIPMVYPAVIDDIYDHEDPVINVCIVLLLHPDTKHPLWKIDAGFEELHWTKEEAERKVPETPATELTKDELDFLRRYLTATWQSAALFAVYDDPAESEDESPGMEARAEKRVTALIEKLETLTDSVSVDPQKIKASIATSINPFATA